MRIVDTLERLTIRVGLLRPATWSGLESDKLYAGFLSRGLAQYETHIGLTASLPSRRNIAHDVRWPMPIRDNSIAIYQAEDVFEHLAYDDIPLIFAEIYRVLRVGGLFRFSVPDYRCDFLCDRSMKNAAGEIVFDPGGGGRFVKGVVVGGGHLWFPVFESVKALFDASPFGFHGRVNFLHYTRADGTAVLNDIDYSQGFVQRTPDNDARVRSPRRALSIVVDARKG